MTKKKKAKKKPGRPIGGKYPAPMRLAWREYKRAQREAEKEAKKIINAIEGKKRGRKKK